MEKQEAIDYLLSSYSHDLIKDIYDYDEVSEAILTILPTFEYPDWDNFTVKDFLYFFNISI